MNSNLPSSILRHLQSIPTSDRALAYLCLDKENLIVTQGGELGRCGIPSLSEVAPIDEQLFFLAELLPIGETPVFIENAHSTEDTILDLHLFADSSGQWVLMFDNTREGQQLQLEQQERLCNDIIREKNGALEKVGAARKDRQSTEANLFCAKDKHTSGNAKQKQSKEEVTKTQSDFEDLLQSSNIGTINLDDNLKLLSYTDIACRVFNLLPKDLGTPIDQITVRTDTQCVHVLVHQASRHHVINETQIVVDDEV